MYDLGNQFKVSLSKGLANNECVFKGKYYRITVLTERLLRLEYNPNGIFNDNLTELVVNRNFEKPNFVVNQNNDVLQINTNYFELTYLKEKNFLGSKVAPMKNLKIKLLNTDKTWYYNHPEVRNFKVNISGFEGKKLQKSLYSQDGFVSIDDSNSYIILENGSFSLNNNKGIDIYVFLYNKDFYYCLNDYFKLTGNPPLLPRYALGNWWNKNENYTDEELKKVVKKFKDNNIPISLFTLNNWNNLSSHDFSSKYNSSDLLSMFKELNIKFGLSLVENNYFKYGTQDYIKLVKYLYRDKNNNIPFNVLDCKTIDAFLKILINPLDVLGIDFYFLKNKDLNFYNILKYYLYNNNYKYNRRPLLLSYNTSVASHRYSISYIGESKVSWNTLKQIPKFICDSSNIGNSFFCYDIGGTKDGIEEGELFDRFVQLGVFSPITMLGSSGGNYYKREPWKWGFKTFKISSDFLKLRYRLIPYLYTESYKYYKFGKPLIEPLYYKYPNAYDDPLYNDEYFLGTSFLVSPITSRKDYIMNRVIEKIFIPKGVWYDFFTGKVFKGEKRYVSFYKEEEYPVFVKAGSIIPMSLNFYNDVAVPKKLEIQVFPGDNNTYSIYEDDGVSNNYLKGEYLITNIEYVYRKNNYGLTILPVSGKKGIIPKFRDYKIVFRNTKMPKGVSIYSSSNKIDGKVYTQNTDLIIEVNDVSTEEQFTITCNGDNSMEIDYFKIIKDDITSIISDLPIKTNLKQKVNDIMFSKEFDIKKKRIKIRKLSHEKEYLESKYVSLMLKLLEYIGEV